jgi:hypothetical protein
MSLLDNSPSTNIELSLYGIFLSRRNSPPVGQGLLIVEDSRTASVTHATVGRTPLDERPSPSQRPQPDNTQHSQVTDIHAPGGIRTHNPSKRAAAEPRL